MSISVSSSVLASALVLGMSASCASVAPPLAPYAPIPQRNVGVERQNLNLLVGYRDVGDDSWEPNDGQITYGLLFDYYRVDQFVGLDAGLTYSSDDSNQGIGQITELFAGVRKTFTFREIFHPYVAAGLSYVWGTNGFDGSAFDPTLNGLIIADQGDSVGVYFRTGAYVTLADHINLGLDIRTLQGTSFDGVFTDDANGIQVALTMGWGF